MKKEVIVLAIGGSVIVPNDIDRVFLKKLDRLIRRLRRRYRLAIVPGGGALARRAVAAARAAGVRHVESLHWIGIRACQANAELIRAILRIRQPLVTGHSMPATSVFVAAPFKPGATSDRSAVRLARWLGAKRIFNVTNVDGVYTADPRTTATARLIPRLDWRTFRRMFTQNIQPGMHTPFDPFAARAAERAKFQVFVLGANMRNLEQAIRGQSFRGTVIGP